MGMARPAVHHRRIPVLVVAQRQRYGVDGMSFPGGRGGRDDQCHHRVSRRHGGSVGGWVKEYWGYHIALGLPVVGVALDLFLALMVRPVLLSHLDLFSRE